MPRTPFVELSDNWLEYVDKPMKTNDIEKMRNIVNRQIGRVVCRSIKGASRQTPQEIKARYKSASFLSDNRVVFNIAGNKYRLVVKINYPYSAAYVRFVGTHAEYDKINAEEI